MSPNTRFQIVYELGPFWANNVELQSYCESNLNDTWWQNTFDDDESPAMDVTTDTSDDAEEFVSAYNVHSKRVYAPATVLLVSISLLFMALLRWCGQTNVKGKDIYEALDQGKAEVYGTV